MEFAYSNLVLDVPCASTKAGMAIIQYSTNNRFNQRWTLAKVGSAYRILNFKSKLCLSIRGQSKKAGTKVVQEEVNGEDRTQEWLLEKQGERLYIVRSAAFEKIYLGVERKSMNEGAGIETTSEEEYAFWRLIGDVDISP